MWFVVVKGAGRLIWLVELWWQSTFVLLCAMVAEYRLSCIVVRSCDGTGRIVGGMGALPGFGWWPLKAYRPCPAQAEAGLSYSRRVMRMRTDTA